MNTRQVDGLARIPGLTQALWFLVFGLLCPDTAGDSIISETHTRGVFFLVVHSNKVIFVPAACPRFSVTSNATTKDSTCTERLSESSRTSETAKRLYIPAMHLHTKMLFV